MNWPMNWQVFKFRRIGILLATIARQPLWLAADGLFCSPRATA